MRISEITHEPQPTRTLYHGTARGLVPEILRYGLIPQVGDFTASAYNEDDYGRMPELIFAADKEGSVHGCISAMGDAIARYYHLPYPKYDNVTFGRYGALCVIRTQVSAFSHRERDDDYFDTDSYPHVEPGDYYAARRIIPDHILTGKKLVWWLEKQRARWEPRRRAYKAVPLLSPFGHAAS